MLGRLFGPKEQSEANSSKKKPLEKLSELFKIVNEKVCMIVCLQSCIFIYTVFYRRVYKNIKAQDG